MVREKEKRWKAEGLEQRIDELTAELSLVVCARVVRRAVFFKTRNKVDHFLKNGHVNILDRAGIVFVRQA